MGGGYMGDVWGDSQQVVESVLNRFPNNPVIILPQTIFYRNKESPSIKSFSQLLTSRNALLFCAREESSLQFCAERLLLRPDQYALVPDLALYINDIAWRGKRDGASICLRSDAESLNGVSYSYCAKVFQNDFSLNVRRVSTVGTMSIPIPIEYSYRAFEKKLVPFQQSKIVVTDRLHGMIMAAISATPVVGLDNISGKVSGVYNRWISSLPYVQLAETSYSLSDQAERAMSVPLENRILALEKCQSALRKEYFSRLGNNVVDFISLSKSWRS
jgi:pyruvyl transferase EpsI